MTSLTLSIEQVKSQTGIGRTKIYELINSGRLPAKKLGKKTLILKQDLDSFLCGLDTYNKSITSPSLK